MIRTLFTLSLLFLLAGCSSETADGDTATAAPELKGTIATSAAPVVMSNLQGHRVYLYFLPMECEPCWVNLEEMNKVREELNMAGIVMYDDNFDVNKQNFAVYELSRRHFITLLPVYTDDDENIAYDYDVEEAPMWLTINEDGMIERRDPAPPPELLKLITLER